MRLVVRRQRVVEVRAQDGVDADDARAEVADPLQPAVVVARVGATSPGWLPGHRRAEVDACPEERHEAVVGRRGDRVSLDPCRQRRARRPPGGRNVGSEPPPEQPAVTTASVSATSGAARRPTFTWTARPRTRGRAGCMLAPLLGAPRQVDHAAAAPVPVQLPVAEVLEQGEEDEPRHVADALVTPGGVLLEHDRRDREHDAEENRHDEEGDEERDRERADEPGDNTISRPKASIAEPRNSTTRKNGSATRPTTPSRGLPIMPAVPPERLAEAALPAPALARERAKSSGASVQATGSGTNAMRYGSLRSRRCTCRRTTSSMSSPTVSRA